VRRPRAVLLLLAFLCSLPALGPEAATAGIVTAAADTDRDLGGWTFDGDPGLFGCSVLQRSGPCGDGDVPSPTPLRIFAKGAVARDAQGLWKWVAPPGVTILGGSVTVSYRTTADTQVYLKTRLRAEAFSVQPKSHAIGGGADGTATWSLPAGREVVGVFLENSASHTFSDKWQNSVRIDRIELELRDDTAPVAAISGPLADGSWQRSAQPVCLDVVAADTGLGVAAAELHGPAGQLLDRDEVDPGGPANLGSADYATSLCTPPAALSDGEHALTVLVTDAAGESASVPLVVRVDAHPPELADQAPLGTTTDRRPAVSFAVDPGPSGLAWLTAELDGVAMTVDGASATLAPAHDLGYGLHAVTWSAADRAGNTRDGFWTFRVVDQDAPVLSAAAPADGAELEARRPAIAFDLTDAGSGIDPATLHVLLDGADVAPFGGWTGDRFTVTPAADLAFGRHEVRVAAADRSGNQLPPAVWTFTVADRVPPALGDVRPDDGSSGSDRTPAVSVAVADSGVGLDPATLRLTLDGVAVAATLDDGRLVHLPPVPLAFGVHTATATVSDLAGNAAIPLVWRFEVRDEAAPAITGKLPQPGATVAGAATIGFDVTDAGVGVDAGSLLVTVDGSDVTTWGSFAEGRFRYAPGNLGAGVHTVAVTVSDRAGNRLGPELWQFAVADPATFDLQLSGPAVVTAGNRATLVAAATSNGHALAGARVEVAARPAGAGAFGPDRTLVASASGVVSWSVAPSRTTVYRVRLADDRSVEQSRTVQVRRRIGLSASRAVLRRGMPLRLAGVVAPRAAGTRVHVQLLTVRGWVTVASPRLGAASGYATTVVPRYRGRYLFRAVAPATADNLAGTSRTVAVRVR
jgi:hypothetical protein